MSDETSARAEPKVIRDIEGPAWVAGQARPPSALAMGAEAAGGVASLGILGLALAAMRATGHQLGSPEQSALMSVALGALSYGMASMITGLGPAIESVASKGFGGKAAGQAGRLLASSLAERSLDLASMALLAPRLALGVPMAIARLKASNPLGSFADMVCAKKSEMKAQLLTRMKEGFDLRTPVGSWRLARDLVAANRADEAVDVWMACPFNPSWSTPVTKLLDKSPAPQSGRKVSFVEALEWAARHCADPQKASHCKQGADAIRVSAELRDLGASPEPELSAGGSSAPAPRSARRSL